MMQLWVKEDQIIPKHPEKIEEMRHLQHIRLKYHSDNTKYYLNIHAKFQAYCG